MVGRGTNVPTNSINSAGQSRQEHHPQASSTTGNIMSALRRVSALTFFLLFTLLAVEVPARVLDLGEQLAINPSQVSAVIEPLVRQARQQSTVTVTIVKTTTISSVLMTTVTTKKTCGVLASTNGTVNPGDNVDFTTAPVAACSRRKRQYWDEPVFIALKEDDNPSLQYFRLSPSQVLSFEPTMLPQFRNTYNPSIELVKESPSALAPSFEKSHEDVRIASPLFGGGINSLISSIVSGILITKTTTTSVVTMYTSTSVSTSFTDTTSFYVVGACYPAGLTIC
ncbi:uncharacterized protein LOC130697831 [Daphnia carinata]|uniref:uncharacterized protein LOC130697831 n=1 Tax=Daphnia carinata TaxID=120202 RepID=UPI002868B023|nr:uncharacterized protein LOC130697831 [Daphnia carinata]